MSNYDLVLGQNPDLALGRSHNLVMGQNHGLALSQRHALGFDNHDLGLSHGHPHDGNHLVLGRHHHHPHPQERETSSELVLCHNHESDVDPDSFSAQNDDFGLSDNQELTLAEVHRKLSAVDEDHIDPFSMIDQSHELALQSSSDMSSQSHVLVPSVLQSRLVVSPNHELAVGQEFPDVESCRRALRDAAIACHFEIQTVKVR